jgi:hydroxylamine reductase
MALLDGANTARYGNPEITKVNIGVRNNPAILISGTIWSIWKRF